MPPIRYNEDALRFAAPRGRRICLTTAKDRHRTVGTTDLESILPVARTVNKRGGPYDVYWFNAIDVEELALRLPPAPPGLAERDGEQIKLTHAMAEYNLESRQLLRIKPTRVSGNQKVFNRRDVEGLAHDIERARQAPTGTVRNATTTPRASRVVHTRYPRIVKPVPFLFWCPCPTCCEDGNDGDGGSFHVF